MTMKRIILTIIFLSLWGLAGLAQHEFSVYSGGGLSALNYGVTVGKQKNGFGGQFGLGYHYFFAPQWGALTGIEFSMYNARFNSDNMSTRSIARDTDENVDFEFRSALSGYKEKQGATLLQIPFMGQYQTTGERRFYAAAGFKLGIPLGGKYSSTIANIKNSGYYAEPEDYEYDTQEFRGFGSFANRTGKGDMSLKAAFFLSLETGMKLTLSEKLSLYAGAYFDYGLNNIRKTETLPLVEYNNHHPPSFTTNSVLSTTFTNKINMMAVGIKVRLALVK